MPFFFDHYPYTNFHNVNLDWVLQAVKAWGALVEENNIKFHNLEEAMSSFRTMLLSEWNTFHDETQNEINHFEIWTQNYLQNLDVQEEINTKLDEMLSSGVLSPYFAPYIQTDVTEWLQDNITPTSPAIDASLTIRGAGADAEETGKHIYGLEGVLGYTPHSFTYGGYIGTSTSTVDINNIHNNNVMSYCVIACSEGDIFTITGTGGSTGRLWAFIDSTGNTIFTINNGFFDHSGELFINYVLKNKICGIEKSEEDVHKNIYATFYERITDSNKNDYEDWQNGKNVQNAFPYLKSHDRELFITGICKSCWKNMFT